MSKIILTVGVSGSGKSYWAEKFARENNFVLLCSDNLRHYIAGDSADQTKNNIVWNTMQNFANILLDQGKTIIIADTNPDRKARKSWVKMAQERFLILEAYVFDTPLLTCLERNYYRNRSVPEEVICNQMASLTTPTKEEGFHNVTTIKV